MSRRIGGSSRYYVAIDAIRAKIIDTTKELYNSYTHVKLRSTVFFINTNLITRVVSRNFGAIGHKACVPLNVLLFQFRLHKKFIYSRHFMLVLFRRSGFMSAPRKPAIPPVLHFSPRNGSAPCSLYSTVRLTITQQTARSTVVEVGLYHSPA